LGDHGCFWFGRVLLQPERRKQKLTPRTKTPRGNIPRLRPAATTPRRIAVSHPLRLPPCRSLAVRSGRFPEPLKNASALRTASFRLSRSAKRIRSGAPGSHHGAPRRRGASVPRTPAFVAPLRVAGGLPPPRSLRSRPPLCHASATQRGRRQDDFRGVFPMPLRYSAPNSRLW